MIHLRDDGPYSSCLNETLFSKELGPLFYSISIIFRSVDVMATAGSCCKYLQLKGLIKQERRADDDCI
jgi:hypothetical protein